MKYLNITLLCLLCFNVNSQDSVIIKARGSRFVVEMPKKKENLIVPLIGIVAAFFGLIGISLQIRARRRDEIIKNQLDRLNKQITEIYGPLYSLYETGHRNYYNFLMLFGDNHTFSNPYYKDWVYTVFQKTDSQMENIIINKADLILGREIPAFFLEFCRWSATRNVYLSSQLKENFSEDQWLPIWEQVKHPQIQMQFYIKASFEKLKAEQSRLLLGKKMLPKYLKCNESSIFGKCLLFLTGQIDYVNEEELIKAIEELTKKYILESVNSNTWENKIWKHLEEKKEEKRREILRQENELIQSHPKNQ